MKFWVTLEDREAEVEFRTEGDRLLLEVDGKRLEADFHRLPDGEVYSLLVDGRSHEVRVSPGAHALEVTVRGTRVPVEVRHPLERMLGAGLRKGGASAGETIVAPMPGLVVSLRVSAGDVVAAGQPVIVVEAMKMQNELTAQHAGVVSDVMVTERQSVAAGQPLMRIRADR